MNQFQTSNRGFVIEIVVLCKQYNLRHHDTPQYVCDLNCLSVILEIFLIKHLLPNRRESYKLNSQSLFTRLMVRIRISDKNFKSLLREKKFIRGKEELWSSKRRTPGGSEWDKEEI